MIIGIQPDRQDFLRDNYSKKWAEFLQARGVTVRWLNLLAIDALEQVYGCNGVMWRWAHTPQDKQSARNILYTIEKVLGISVYPDVSTAWHFDEKIAQYYLLQALKAPIPSTWIFWDRDSALSWVGSEASYPMVFKLSAGAGSTNVIKIADAAQAQTIISRMFDRGVFSNTFHRKRHPKAFVRFGRSARDLLRRVPDGIRFTLTGQYPALHPILWRPEAAYAYFQEFLPDNAFDTRITVIGNRAFGFRRLNRLGDFRASGSGHIEYDPQEIDLRCVEIAFDVSTRGGFQSMAYDFLLREGQPVIGEISYAYLDSAVQACPGHWDRELNWCAGSMWPEEAQIEDFLVRISQRTQ